MGRFYFLRISEIENIASLPFLKIRRFFSEETKGLNSVTEWQLITVQVKDEMSSCLDSYLPLLTLPQKASLLRGTLVLPHSYPVFQPLVSFFLFFFLASSFFKHVPAKESGYLSCREVHQQLQKEVLPNPLCNCSKLWFRDMLWLFLYLKAALCVGPQAAP